MTAIVRVKNMGIRASDGAVIALPGNAETMVLFSTADPLIGTFPAVKGACPMGNWGPMMGIHSFHWDIGNDQAGTIRGYKSSDRGVTWTQFHTEAVAASAAGTTNSGVVLVEGFADFKFDWLNGATPQTAFPVDLDCSTFP